LVRDLRDSASSRIGSDIPSKYAGLLSTGAKPIVPMQGVNIDDYEKFKQAFDQWIRSSKLNVRGLPAQSTIVSGLTDAFNQTYALYHKIGIFEGEYGYHRLAMGERVTTDLSTADVIIISHPFSADGFSSHDKLAHADSFGKPIFVDCAFLGICDNVSFDLSAYKHIHSVGFSLSKTFGSGKRRVGMLYTKDCYPSLIYDPWKYQLVSSAEHHYDLITQIGPDQMFDLYRPHQLEICNDLGLEPSDTVIFGLDRQGRYPEYKRGNVDRICISLAMRARINT
jgi:hypothetical protein